ncbi:hypothetical protein niasHS_012836 [Heterodera schachtii]|uniref:Nuclear receptor domain-containing protein n=1 Tax=Heterodera schachtii TaxID=97005 RepID=A0ABD2I643_HETSC
MNPNAGKKSLYLLKCAVCNCQCQYFYYGAKCCESCKHFFRRTISLMKEYKCKDGGECKDLASCKRCRLYKCLTVGMKPQGVCPTKLNDEQTMAFAERMKEHPRKSAVFNSAPEQNELMNFIMLQNLLQIEEKIALCSNIAMPLYVLCNSFYSVQQRCDVLCAPDGLMPIKMAENSFYKQDSVVMRMGDKMMRNAVQPFARLKLINEEFVLIRAIIYSHMVSPGLSDQAQKLLRSEAEKYAALLMSVVQTNYGLAAGALRYMELMGLIEWLFNTGVKYRQMLTYISNVLDPNFDKVFPPVLAKICTKGPVESHQLFPY